MDPEVAKRLQQENPDVAELIKHIKREVMRLDSLSQMPKTSDDRALAIEIAGRERAQEILVAILKPLINTQDFEPADMSEYVV